MSLELMQCIIWQTEIIILKIAGNQLFYGIKMPISIEECES